ncbi:hypothetical protein H2200_008033 [Cladophialophora chaetospira]|uniref:Uncharacterized protein n=1 Tax=Cladophialophora chaetospira TaxID=386627 RepID=A0AA38X725_9EURO|nr:hypothetical protein H2200_008033 [Cladophialophora chaetospira]
MPSKYSHGVVLADYSSRGIIGLPNDKQLHYLKSGGVTLPVNPAQQSASATRGRPASTPPSQKHRSTVRPISTRTSKSSKKRSSVVSVNDTPSQEFRSDTATSHYRTLGVPQTTSSASRSRKIIIDSDEEYVDDNDEKHQDSQPGVPTVAETPCSQDSAGEDDDSIQHPNPNQDVKFLRQPQAATRRSESKHVSLLAAQKYARKADSRNRAQPSCQPNEPFLSLHEFLDPSSNSRPNINKGPSEFATGPGARGPRLTKVPSTIPESPRHASKRVENIIGISDDGENQHDQYKNDSGYGAASVGSQRQGRRRKELEQTEERPSELIDTPAITHSQSDLSQSSLDEPDFEVSKDYGNPAQNEIAAEPDFSNFSDDEERGDPMNSALANTSPRTRYYRAAGRSAARGEPSSDISQSRQLNRGKNGRRLWSLSSARSKAPSMGSDIRDQGPATMVKRYTGAEVDSTLHTLSTARNQNTEQQQLLKLKSEEQMRAQIPTPIPSPASSAVPTTPLRTGKTLQASPMSVHTPSEPVRHLSRFGTPSIVRSPQGGKHIDRVKMTSPTNSQNKSSTTHRQTTIHKNPQDTITPTQNFRDEGISRPDAFYLNHDIESEEDDADESWTLPTTPISQQPAFFKNTPLTRLQADFVSQSRPGSTTPRPQQQTRRRSQTYSTHRTTAVDRSLEPTFDDISSTSSSYLDHHSETEPHTNAPYPLVYQHEEESDPDAALPPPDISRYPSARTSSRSRKNEHRLSSLTALPRRSKTKRRSTISYDDRIDTLVRNLNVPEGSGSEADTRRADDADTRPGPGKTTGLERLEALMRKAEDEAKANRGIKGFWGRFKRRI